MRKGTLVAGLVLLVLVAQVSAQISFNFAGQGARALGMGGAFIGIADDATAISWNPAGLGQLDRPELSGVGKFTASKLSWDPTTVTQYGYTENFKSTSESHFVLNFGSGAMPIKMANRNLVFAVAYQQQLDFYTKQEYQDTFTIWNNNPPYNADTLTGTKVDKTTGAVYTISPGFGFQVTPRVLVGAACNIWTGSPTEKITRDLTSQNFAFFGTNRTYEWKDKMVFGGLNFTAGALVDVKPVKLGAVIRTPLSLKLHDETSERMRETSRYWNTTYENWDTTLRYPREGSIKYKFPFMFGFGISVSPTQNFTLAADYDFRPLSSVTLVDSSGKDFRETPNSDTLDWPSSNQIRLGVEYLLMYGGGIVPLRAGFYTDPLIDRHVDFNSTTKGGQVTGIGFTFGTGFAVKRFQFDVAYGYNTASQEWKWDTSGLPNPASSKEKASTHSILGSAIFKF
jgi:long-subunit fatty acid transport protein